MPQPTITRFVFPIVLICFLYAGGYAQQVNSHAGFVQDSIRLGDPIDYYLVARYPSQLTVLFPDSLFGFEPFEFISKRYYPTITKQGESYDSAVYTFTTFEIASIQYLQLPVFAVHASDCTRYDPLRDSVFLKSMIQGPVPDSVSAQDLPLKVNTLYKKVFFLFNYPILLIVVGSLIVLTIFIWIAFGKRIKKYFRIKKLKKNHIKFQELFTRQKDQLKTRFTVDQTETALSEWKKYLEKLEQKPYTKMTTRETIALEKDEKLGTSLHLLDRAIYGNETAIVKPLEHLQQIASDRFIKKLEEVNHG